MTVRWAILGPGRIAAAVKSEFDLVDGADVRAVASRSQQRADGFAVEHGIERAYGSLDAVLADPDIDAVYVATPHSAHAAQCVAIANAGKAMLVEKSMACTPAETDIIIAAAQRNRVFCMEAMWTRFVPLVVTLRQRVHDGAIGDLRSIQGDLHAYRAFDPDDRLFHPDLGGGALLDLGVYVVAFAQDFLGQPRSVACVGSALPNGVDGTASMVLGYDGGATASLTCSFESYGPGRMALLGTDGWIDLLPRFHHPGAFVIHRPGRDDERVDIAPTGRGYTHEIEEACRRIEAGETESPVMPLSASASVSRTLDECARQLKAAWAGSPAT